MAEYIVIFIAKTSIKKGNMNFKINFKKVKILIKKNRKLNI